MKLKIEHIPVDRLVPYARNARTHSDEQVAQIAASIAEFGFVNPILVGEDDVIIAGHGRLLAARKMGMTEVPVIRLGHLSETQRRALIIADNRIAENSAWDEDLLRLELEELRAEDFDLDITGFDLDEIDRLLQGTETAVGNIDDDEVPEASSVPVSKTGDLWLLGNHRLLCGDATVLADVERVLDGGLADMTFCDPPYNVDYGNSAKDKMRGKDRRIMNDNLGEGFYRFLYDACVNILTVTKGGAYICMSSSELHTLQKAFMEAGGHWSTFVIWAKNTFTLGRADYQRQYEPILYGWKEGADHFWCGARDQGDVWFVDKPRKNDLHPTMKPVALVERAVRNSSKSRDTVLDPFGGSGTTMIACEKAGRIARLVEMDPKYVDVIIKRWQEFSGLAATLEADGRTFNDAAADKKAVANAEPKAEANTDARAEARHAVVEERNRAAGIFDAARKLGIERTVAEGLVERGMPLIDARKTLIDAVAERDEQTETRSQITLGRLDERQTRQGAVEAALLHRFDPNRFDLSEPAREWRGYSLLELARAFLEADGTKVRGLSRDEIATRALHSTSDFPDILAAVTNKTLREAYQAAPRTFPAIARRASASDFKDIRRLQLGEAPQLEKVAENGEFKRGTMGEGKESYRVETYGKVIGITRQVIINDDLDAFTRVPSLFGTSAATLESDVVWGIITSNPAMGDGKALFHAGHKNLAGTGTALDVANLGKARAFMAKQVGLDGKTILNIRPAYLVVPSTLELTAEQIIAQNLVPTKSGDVVPQSIRSLAVIAEPRLDPASGAVPWYLFASPSAIDTIEYAYLEGQEGVYIETRMGFDVDGIEIKARLDFGAKAIDWRGMHKNPGV